MKAILLSLAFAIGLGANAQATDHSKKTAEEKAQRRTERMTTDLGLSADQKTKIAEINLNYAKAMVPVMAIENEKSRNGRADYLKESRDRGYESTLTPEQYKKYMDLRAEKKAKHDADKKSGTKGSDESDD